MKIIEAKDEDSEKVTQISFKSKQYWNYPKEYFEIWKDELLMGHLKEYCRQNKISEISVLSDPNAKGFYEI